VILFIYLFFNQLFMPVSLAKKRCIATCCCKSLT